MQLTNKIIFIFKNQLAFPSAENNSLKIKSPAFLAGLFDFISLILSRKP
jgi:hypothetical protein